MAKKRSKSRVNNTRKHTPMRGVTNTARRSTRLHAVIEDNRLFHPIPRAIRPIVSVTAKPLSIRTRPNAKSLARPVQMRIPRHAMVCARRRIRKEVIFASGNQGRGNRRPKFNENSTLICK